MNYYKDGSDYIEGYNPIVSDTRIPDRYNPDNEIGCIDDWNRIKDELDCNRNVQDECSFKVI